MVHIDSIKYFNDFRPESVDWLLANVGDKIRIEIDLSVKTYVVASSTEGIRVNCADGFIGAGWTVDEGGGRFKDFRIGDSVLFYDRGTAATSSFTIVDKLDDSTIQLNANFTGTAADSVLTNHVFSVSTPITSLRYKWNFIENTESVNYFSKISGTEQRLVVVSKSASDTSVSNMIFLGEKSYQTGNATVQGVSILNSSIYESHYKIIHYTTITPFMLSEQWDDLKAGIQPEYFLNSKCLKNVYNIEAAKDYNDPNWEQMVEQDSILGNTGGFGENFNSGITNYYIDSISILNGITPRTKLQLTTDELNVSIVVKNTVDSPFSNNNTKFEVQMLKAPFDDSEYSLNGRTVDENFINDRAFQTVGSAPVNGSQFGVSGRQCLKNVSATFNSSSQITINLKVAMLASTVSVFSESNEPRYILNLALQNHTLSTKLSDIVRIPVSVSEFFIDNSDPNMINKTTLFFRHPEDNLDTQGGATLLVAPEDEVVAYTKMFIENAGRETDEIIIKSINCKLKAKNSVTNDEFNLENFNLPFADQNINFLQDRVFHIPANEIRKPISVQRRVDLDVAQKQYYTILYPFKVRWEYWVKLIGANTAFFNASQPQNGLNNKWHKYTLLSNWGLYYELTVSATKNGIALNYTDELPITSFDYNSNSEWNLESIKSFDGATELISGGKKYLMGFKDTKIVASFHKTDNTAIDLSKAVVNILIEVFESGGIEGQRRMSSIWSSDSDTWFKSINGSDKVVLSLATTVSSNDTIKATVNVGADLIPSSSKFSITARLYYLNVPPYTAGKLFENGDPMEFQTGDSYEFQNA
jgi:hypothetical protein